jgi:CRISPR/Cas system-associated exonuclease Cas4 (RecB family)
MELNLNELHSYLECPLKYKFVHKDESSIAKTNSIIFKEAIHKTISFFFFSVMNGTLPSLGQMKEKWSAMWEETYNPRSMIDEILSVHPSFHYKQKGNVQQKDPESTKYQMSGIEMIYNFYRFNKDNPGNIIGVDLPYRVALDDVTIIGSFELVREIIDSTSGKRYIEIVDFKTGTDTIDPFLVKHDLDLSLASYAFRELFQSTEDHVKYHYLKTGRDIIIHKQESDFARMKSIIGGVKQGIQAELHYPRQSHMCKACSYKDMCDRVKF